VNSYLATTETKHSRNSIVLHLQCIVNM